MGGKGSKLNSRSRHANVLFLGLDGAGKTQLLAKVCKGGRGGERGEGGGGEGGQGGAAGVFQRVSTRGCGLVRLSHGGFRLNCFDLGGSPASRTTWASYFHTAHCVVFVIDGTDRRRIEKAGATLQTLLGDPRLAGVPLLILANKQDMLSAVSGTELSDGLNCSQIRGRLWQIQQTSARTGEGIQAAFAWMGRTLAEQALSAKEQKRISFALHLHK